MFFDNQVFLCKFLKIRKIARKVFHKNARNYYDKNVIF